MTEANAVFVKLSREISAQMIKLAKRRMDSAPPHWIERDCYRKDKKHTTLEVNTAGFRGEWAAAEALHVRFLGADGDRLGSADPGYDLVLPDGRTVQVKTSNMEPANHLPLCGVASLSALSADVVVLCHDRPDLEGVLIIGWLALEEYAELAEPNALFPGIKVDGGRFRQIQDLICHHCGNSGRCACIACEVIRDHHEFGRCVPCEVRQKQSSGSGSFR